MILTFIVNSLQTVKMIYLTLAASLQLPNNQVCDRTIFTEFNMIIMVKKKSVTNTAAIWKIMWMSTIMKSLWNKDSSLKSYSTNSV